MSKNMHLFDYLYTRVKIKTKDERILEGDVDSVESAIESDQEYDSIYLDHGEWIEGIFENEIESIEVIKRYPSLFEKVAI
jgi:hypothetical protein